jgi:putative SOS response-associated peptidase YedK
MSNSGGYLYEWKKVVGGKIPYAIGMKDDSPFVFAALWKGWKDPFTNEWYVPARSSQEIQTIRRKRYGH